MKFHRYTFLALLVAFHGVFTAQARMVREVSESFSVEQGGLLSLSTQGGNIEVIEGKSDTVTVRAKLVFRRADSEEEADEIMEDLDLTIEQTDEGVRATSKRLSQTSRWFGWGRSNQVSVHFYATVPAQYNVDARTSGGDIEVSDLTGEVRARTSGGNIAVGHIRGAVDLGTSGGNIDVAHAVGAVDAHTSGGNIRVDDAEGSVKASTSGGDVHIGRVVGVLRATTSGGNVSARLQGPLQEDAVLSTSGGHVTAWVEDDIGFRLDASTSGGRVRADGVTIKIEAGGVGRNKLVGEVNGGGPTLKLRSSGGNVKVVTN